MKPTIKDIAAKAGVSKTTVSFALNNPMRISKETREKILAIVDEMGYFPNPVARTLTTKRLGSLGLLLPQPLPEVLNNPHLCDIISGIGDECEKRGFSLTMLPPVHGRIMEAARRSFVDAIVTIGVGPDHEVVEFLNSHGIPFVTIDGEETSSTVNVGIPDELAAYDLMRHMLSLGHRKMAILCVKPDTKSVAENDHRSIVLEKRLSGFSRALNEVGLNLVAPDISLMETEGSLGGGKNAGEKLFALEPGARPTAIVAMADIIALGTYAAAREAGLAIPDDVSVAGFDDIEQSRYYEPALTTVHQSGRQKGQKAASMAVELLNGGHPAHCSFPCNLIVRQSTGPAPARSPSCGGR